ncbi:DUF1016 N-terminal domain-containing protein [Sorangium sp. So ce117]|uniref:DUF1016 N-terminal domain-containing protein n=1 Tax=Sorangium sp. So ce117 TaxID=3133277 RepID=UPI003F6396BB
MIAALAQQLQRRYGRGFSEKTLRRMVQFVEALPEEPIVATLSRRLTWDHFVLPLPLDASLARAFSTLRGAASSAGACAHSARRSTACSTSGPRSPASPRASPKPSSRRCGRRTRSPSKCS